MSLIGRIGSVIYNPLMSVSLITQHDIIELDSIIAEKKKISLRFFGILGGASKFEKDGIWTGKLWYALWNRWFPDHF